MKIWAQYRIALFLLLATFLAIGLVSFPRGYKILVPAECPECLCNGAPACVPIMEQSRGIPLIASSRIVGNNITDYKSNSLGATLDSVFGIFAAWTIIFRIGPFLKQRRNAHTRH